MREPKWLVNEVAVEQDRVVTPAEPLVAVQQGTLAQHLAEIPGILQGMGIDIPVDDLNQMITEAWEEAQTSQGGATIPPVTTRV